MRKQCIVKDCPSNLMVGADIQGLDNAKNAVSAYRTALDLQCNFSDGFGLGTLVRNNKSGKVGVVVAVEINTQGNIKLSYMYSDNVPNVQFKLFASIQDVFGRFLPIGHIDDFDFTALIKKQHKIILQKQLADLQQQIAQL